MSAAHDSHPSSSARQPGAFLGRLVAICCAVTVVLYLRAIQDQGSSIADPVVIFVSCYIAVLGLCAGTATIVKARPLQVALLGAAAGGLLELGYLAAMSIGLALLVLLPLTIIAASKVAAASRAEGHRRSLLPAGLAGTVVACSVLSIWLEYFR